MAHSSSKWPSPADDGLILGRVAAALLAGTVFALLIEGAGVLDSILFPVGLLAQRWMLVAFLVIVVAWGIPQPLRWPLAGFLVGLWMSLSQLAEYHRHLLSETDAAGDRWLVAARVLSIPERSGADLSFTAELVPARPPVAQASAAPAEPSWPLRVRLQWRRAPRVLVGEIWQLPVTLSPLSSPRNPGQGWFDRQSLRAGVHASGTVLDSRLIVQMNPAPLSIDAVRAWFAARIHAAIAERDSAALLVALAVGDTQYVSREQWRVFNATGITHLIAISGLHVTLFSLLTAALARRVWAGLPWLWQHVRREHCAALSGVLAAWGYALLSGFSVPAQRTLIMLATWHGLRCLARPAAAAPALAVAVIFVLLLDPLAPLSAGFWLSFSAVAVLIHALPVAAAPSGTNFMQRAVHAAMELWRTQWRVALGLLPITLAVFGSASVAGLYVNLVAIPLFSFALVPLILCSLPLLPLWPSGAHGLLQAAAHIATLMMPWLTRAADWDHALWRIHAPPWAVLLAVPAVWLLLLPGRWFVRSSACCALLPLLWPQSSAPASGEFIATVLDTGISQSIIVRTAHHALLYDNGEHWGSDGMLTRNALLPALRGMRLRELDRVVMPCLDNDRAAGLAALASESAVTRWQAGGAVLDLPPEFAPCLAGERWQWDGVQFESLLDDECVIRISVPRNDQSAGGATMLLAPEIDRTAQQRLLDAGSVHSDVLLVPRHAAAIAHLPEFRAATGARWAVVAQSRRGAGTAAVQRTLAAWQQGGAQLWITGISGAVEIHGRGGQIDLRPAGH